MKLKNIIFLTGMLLPVGSAFAQYTEDALRFSQTELGTTARFRAMGGAQTALGGDISSLSSNPAGLGLLTKSELTFSPEFTNSNVKSGYLGSNTSAVKGTLGVNQVGIVFYNPARRYSKDNDNDQGRLSTNFAIGYNKTNNFNSTIDYQGLNSTSSFADYIAGEAYRRMGNGNPATNTNALPSGSLEKMAYEGYLIEYDPSGYFVTTAVNPGTAKQRNVAYQTGSQSELNVGGAMNFGNTFYAGLTISLTSLNYNVDREFTETGNTRSYATQPAALVNATYGLTYNAIQETRGSGFNAKLGLMYRPSSSVRIGASFISPTWYSISDEFSEELETRYTQSNGAFIAPYTNTPQNYPFDYSLRTPYRLNGGIAFLSSGLGLISGDVEYVDYSSIKFESTDMVVDNNTKRSIRETYNPAVNLRLGLEFKLDKSLMVRAGYSSKGNPYKESDFTANTLTGGIGYRVKNIALDLAYTTLSTEFNPKPYTINSQYPDINDTGSGPASSVKNITSQAVVTLSARF